MAIPNMLDEVKRARIRYPEAWKNAHTGNSQTEDFIKLLAKDLHKIDARFGLNGKRGNPLDLSDDAINYIGEGPGHDPLTLQPITVFDVIRGAGGPNPQPSWDRVDQDGPGAWVDPNKIPTPPPIPTPGFPYPDEQTSGKLFLARVVKAYADAGRTFPDPGDKEAYWHFSRFGYSCSKMPSEQAIEKHIGELRSALGV